MTKITVQPIDSSAEGSFEQSIQLMEISSVLQGEPIYGPDGAGHAPTMREIAGAMKQIKALIRARATTDDGSDVDAAIAKLSLDQMKQLSQDLEEGAGGPVPPTSAVALRLPPRATAGRRNGSKS